MREVRADLGAVRERVTRLEARFDEEFPRPHPTPRWSCYSAVAPPSTGRATPWMCRARSEARKHYRIGDVRRAREAPVRRIRGPDSPPLLRAHAELFRFPDEHRGVHPAGTYRVHANVLPGMVDRHRPGERDDRALRRAVRGHSLARHDAPRSTRR